MQRLVGSVRSAIAILRHLEQSGDAQGVNALSRALGINPSSCFNILKTLVEEQFLDFDDKSKRYSLGPGAIALGRSALDSTGAFAIVRRKLEQVADEHRVTAGLWRVHRDEQLLLIGLAESADTTRIHLSIGQRLPIAAGAGGRCALAFSDANAEVIGRRLKVVKWINAPTLSSYMQEVKTTRERGWAIDEGRFRLGVTTLAAPVLNPEGHMGLGITATMFTGQHELGKLQMIAENLVEVAAWLSERLFLSSR